MLGSNVEFGADFTGKLPVVFRDDERYRFILGKVKSSGADIVAFQEIWAEKYMERLMSDLQSVYPFRHRGSSGALTKGGSGLVMVSKVPFGEGDFFKFPDPHDDEDSWATKGVLRATLQSARGGVSIGISHCWTDAGGDGCTNIRDIIAHTTRDGRPAIMMGDFNIHRSGRKYSTLDAMMKQTGAADCCLDTLVRNSSSSVPSAPPMIR